MLGREVASSRGAVCFSSCCCRLCFLTLWEGEGGSQPPPPKAPLSARCLEWRSMDVLLCSQCWRCPVLGCAPCFGKCSAHPVVYAKCCVSCLNFSCCHQEGLLFFFF